MTNLKEIIQLDETLLFGILDSVPGKEIDELLNIACTLTGCPYAAITIIGKSQQWLKTNYAGNRGSFPNEISFYNKTMVADEAFITMDAGKELHEGSVNGPGSCFYMGVPVFSTSGKRIGALSVVAQKPMEPTGTQVEGLRLISRHITVLMQAGLGQMLDKEQSEKVLFENDRYFQSFFSQGMLPKWIYEVGTLKFLQVNDAAVEKYGYSREEFLQMSVFDIRTADTKTKIHELVQIVKGKENESTFRSWHQTRSGKKLDVEVTIHDIMYMGIPARVATIIDITEKENLQKALENEKKAVEEKITKAELAAIRETKDFIGKELHDNINQLLVSIKLYLDFALKNEDMREELMNYCKDIVDDAIQSIRQLTCSLVTIEESNFLLGENLGELVKSYSRVNTFEIQLSVEDAVEELPADIKLNLYRIIQEQLNNITKYANATEVRISIRCGDHLQLEIKDNGIGFDPEKKRSGIGLRNIQRRAEFYKGSMEILPADSKGMTVLVRLPLLKAC